MFLQGRNWKACDTLGDSNSKQWKLYNWLNIVNIFKKMIDFSFEKRKNFPFNPIISCILLNTHDTEKFLI
jgi:hypothetical protein